MLPHALRRGQSATGQFKPTNCRAVMRQSKPFDGDFATPRSGPSAYDRVWGIAVGMQQPLEQLILPENDNPFTPNQPCVATTTGWPAVTQKLNWFGLKPVSFQYVSNGQTHKWTES